MYEELANAINKTCENHPEYTMADHFYRCLRKYYDSLRNGKGPVLSQIDFYNGFSRVDSNGKPVRERLMRSMVDNNRDGALVFLKLVYDVCASIIGHYTERNTNNQTLRYAHYFVFEYNKINNGRDIEEVRDRIYRDPILIQGILNTIYPLLEEVNLLITPKEKKPREIKSGIVFNSITDTANKRITNVRANNIQDSFAASLYNGRVQIASHVGKKSRQEDAVLSVKKDNCIMNIVADGMGGSTNGHIASMYIVKEMADWFSKLDTSKIPMNLEDVKDPENNPIFNSIKNKLQEINDKINSRYGGKNGPGSTIVLSFSTPSYTLIINVGDSTAYLKSGSNYKLLTKIDAAPEISDEILKDYELYRNIGNNNVVSRYIGCGAKVINPHGTIIDHKEERKLLLSSDGVTDLINEENFRKLFLGKATAIDFVDKALNPDKHVKPAHGEYERLSSKTSDNISAILMDIPKNTGRKM